VCVGRHADVDDCHVRLVHSYVAQEVPCVPRLGDDLEAGLAEQSRHALAQENGIVREHDPQRVSERGDRVSERREIARKVVRENLCQVLGKGQALDALLVERASRDGLELSDGLRRRDDLPAVRCLWDPDRAHDVDSRGALVAEGRGAGVDADPDLCDCCSRPLLVPQSALRGESRVHSPLRLREDREELVTRRVDLAAAVRADRLAQDRPDARPRRRPSRGPRASRCPPRFSPSPRSPSRTSRCS